MRRAPNSFYVNRYFLAGFVLYFLTGLFFLLATSKASSFLFLNAHHNPWLDDFFVLYTNLGDGLFSIAVVLLLLVMRRYRMAWQVLAAYIVSGLLAQLIKHLVVSPRPVEFFKFKEPIFYLAGVTNSGNGSFPSGHAASIFALATMLAYFAGNKWISWLYLLGAISVGYSRIYLSQHFLTDVLAGSLVGVCTAVAVHFVFTRWSAAGGNARSREESLEDEAAAGC
jgi:membrane-associated phospholipid phosphatase